MDRLFHSEGSVGHRQDAGFLEDSCLAASESMVYRPLAGRSRGIGNPPDTPLPSRFGSSLRSRPGVDSPAGSEVRSGSARKVDPEGRCPQGTEPPPCPLAGDPRHRGRRRSPWRSMQEAPWLRLGSTANTRGMGAQATFSGAWWGRTLRTRRGPSGTVCSRACFALSPHARCPRRARRPSGAGPSRAGGPSRGSERDGARASRYGHDRWHRPLCAAWLPIGWIARSRRPTRGFPSIRARAEWIPGQSFEFQTRAVFDSLRQVVAESGDLAGLVVVDGYGLVA